MTYAIENCQAIDTDYDPSSIEVWDEESDNE